LLKWAFRSSIVLEQTKTTPPTSKPKRAMLGFVFSLAGSVLILIRGLIWITAGDVIRLAGSDELRRRVLAGMAISVAGGIAVAFAALIIVGAILIYSKMEVAGCVIVLIFSVLSLFVGSGWLIGFILGLVGGILALLRK
jgi:hypothetical protein